MAEPTLQYVIYNLFPDQEARFVAAFQEALRAAEGGTCRYELARAQGKEANYILRIESLSPSGSAGASLWLVEPLRWFMSSIVSTAAYERVNAATTPVPH